MKKILLPVIVSPLGLITTLSIYWIGGGEFYRHHDLGAVVIVGLFMSIVTGMVTLAIIDEMK